MRTATMTCVSAILIGVAATALSAQQAPPPVCEQEEPFRDFDFWIGEWDVVVNDSTRAPAGTNSIQPRHRHCVLEENWTSLQGGTGSSMNYYDPTREAWRQVWVAASYVIDIEGGLNAEGSMVLEGEIRSFVQNSSSPFRGTWTPIDDGVVRQFFEIGNAETGVFTPWFDGLYLRKDRAPDR